MNKSSGAPLSPARKISATAARRAPFSSSALTALRDSSAEHSFTMSGWALSPTRPSPPVSLLLFTSSRCRVSDEKLYRLQHDLFQNRRNLIERMCRVKAVARALDEPKRTHTRRHCMQTLRLVNLHR